MYSSTHSLTLALDGGEWSALPTKVDWIVMLFDYAVSATGVLQRCCERKLTVNAKYLRIWKEEFAAYLKVYSSRETKENHEVSHSRWPVPPAYNRRVLLLHIPARWHQKSNHLDNDNVVQNIWLYYIIFKRHLQSFADLWPTLMSWASRSTYRDIW
jgi:hypothetical protein